MSIFWRLAATYLTLCLVTTPEGLAGQSMDTTYAFGPNYGAYVKGKGLLFDAITDSTNWKTGGKCDQVLKSARGAMWVTQLFQADTVYLTFPIKPYPKRDSLSIFGVSLYAPNQGITTPRIVISKSETNGFAEEPDTYLHELAHVAAWLGVKDGVPGDSVHSKTYTRHGKLWSDCNRKAKKPPNSVNEEDCYGCKSDPTDGKNGGGDGGKGGGSGGGGGSCEGDDCGNNDDDDDGGSVITTEIPGEGEIEVTVTITLPPIETICGNGWPGLCVPRIEAKWGTYWDMEKPTVTLVWDSKKATINLKEGG